VNNTITCSPASKGRPYDDKHFWYIYVIESVVVLWWWWWWWWWWSVCTARVAKNILSMSSTQIIYGIWCMKNASHTELCDWVQAYVVIQVGFESVFESNFVSEVYPYDDEFFWYHHWSRLRL
jgi:hypothetical protein